MVMYLTGLPSILMVWNNVGSGLVCCDNMYVSVAMITSYLHIRII